MPKWNRILLYVCGAIATLAVLYIAFYFIFLNLLVDLWWFRSLDYGGYFWLRLLYRFFISGGITLFFFSIFFLHFWIASRYLGFNPATDTDTKGKSMKGLFREGSLKIYTPIALILAIVIAIPLYQQWESALLYFYHQAAGVSDPVFGYDISFYLFSLPVYQLIQRELLSIAVILFILIYVLYWLEHRIVAPKARDYPLGARIHLTVLLLFVIFFVTWEFMLERFGLLFTDSHEPVFYGPGFVEMRYQLPLIWLSIIVFLGFAGGLLVLIHSHGAKGRRLVPVFAVLFLSIIGLRGIVFIPQIIEKLVVQPNPVKTEKAFMKNNIDATLAGYGLDSVKTLKFDANINPADDLASANIERELEDIPLWDRELLEDVYFQLQGLRPYYNFPNVDEDRYVINGDLHQVNLAARELNFERLPAAAQTWENKHLRYTHGYGAVMTPAAQQGDKPIEWYLRGLKMKSDLGFAVKHPDIYYGPEEYTYAIVPNKLDIKGLAGSKPDEKQMRTRKGGIPIPSLFRKLLLAFYFGDEKIFFSINISDASRVRIRRNITERIESLTPFFALDSDPYLVVAPDAFYWVQDAYTLSDRYPVSKPSDAWFRHGGARKRTQFNYIRNSVKIVVNAYNGSTHFYIVDPKDPIAQAYQRAYPGVLKPMKDIPAALKPHLRYPRDIFYHQMKIYARYHQIEPELFYQQAETWEFSSVNSVELKPYYLTTALQGCPELKKFVLINPMTPIRRDNLSALTIGGSLSVDECGTDYSAAITSFKFPRDTQVEGPAQVSALIDQDPRISEQFTLWDQHGSKVEQGRMIVLPMGKSILYVQPVYLISTRKKIPELTRVIVSAGNEVIMDKSLEAAFARLKARFKDKQEKPAPDAKQKTSG